MARLGEFVHSLHPYVLSSIAGTMTVAQIVLTVVLHRSGSQPVRTVGIALWWVGAVFGWLSIFTLRRKGGVARGKSYVHTTELVDNGVYGIVRHPQMGTAWILMSVALVLVGQHWSGLALAIAIVGLVYLDLLKADERLVEKFGDAYRQYMQRVPRVNFVVGAIRRVRQRVSAQGGDEPLA